MSVASRNPFALLDEDPSSSPSVPAAPAKEAAAAPAASTRGTQKARGGPASRGGRYYSRGGKSSAPHENGETAAEDATGESRRRFDGEGRGRGRGRGRGGDRGDRGRGGRGRPFDRHSATGKVDSEKKVHQGWGGDEGNTELKDEVAAETDAKAEAGTPTGESWGVEATSADAWAAPGDAPTGDVPATEGEKAEGRPRREREPEEEDNTVTLEEYLKQQKEKELEIVPKLEVRKANEGDDSIWKDAVVVSKKDEEETAYFVGKSKSAPKVRAKKEEKVFLEIDARFERPSRGGRGGRGGDRGDRPPRGGRGGRGGRGRGANGGNRSTPALDVDDQTAFPSLA